MKSKKATCKKNFYLPILNELKRSTNLSKIREKLGLTKQQLNYYLRRLKKDGVIRNISYGSWKFAQPSKNPSKYGKRLVKDSVRGHGYIINIKLPENLPNWKNRISILKAKKVNYKLVGAQSSTPRIKALGRKVWLCNNHLRIYDKPFQSYYGINAIESRVQAFYEFKKIINVIENKLGIKLNPTDISFQKEHYALIKNDLAIQENQEGNIWRIKDEEGEWLLIDDSLGEGGELETVGKKALVNSVPMQKWWNEHKEFKFKVSPKNITKKFMEMEKHIEQLSELNNKSVKYQLEMQKQLNQLTMQKTDKSDIIPSYIM